MIFQPHSLLADPVHSSSYAADSSSNMMLTDLHRHHAPGHGAMAQPTVHCDKDAADNND